MKITFATSQPWRDCRGRHVIIPIYGNGKEIGLIHGELDQGVGPGMEYKAKVEIPGHQGAVFVNFKLNALKAVIREEFSHVEA